MSLIDKAAKRLDELKQAGIELPPRDASNLRREPVGLPPQGDEPRIAAKSAPAVNAVLDAVAVTERGQLSPFERMSELEPVRGQQPFKPVQAVRSRRVEIDLARLSSFGYITPDAPRSKLADEFRVIKRPLLLNAHGKSASPIQRANLIMVTSSVAGEGKTYAAINLAMSMASEVDNTVLLVDADTARPAVFGRLGLPRSRGLIDVLQADEPDLSEVIVRTNVDKLTLMPAGSRHDHATELLASDSMRRLLDELATRYSDRIIIFDAPPLLPAPEARVLASRMGQIVFVVEADHTPQNAVSEALGTIEKCPVVMTMLNKARRLSGEGYYGYYGGYGTTPE